MRLVLIGSVKYCAWVEFIYIFRRNELYGCIDGWRHLFVVQYIESELNHILSIVFRKSGNGADQPGLWKAQFASCLWKGPDSQGEAETASADF